nr:class I SAM-dependent methyltransferase [Planctomycetota bacterium]
PFRRGANDEVCRAYCAMSSDEFAGVNARQRWANWRTIPKNIDGVLPNRPLAVIDLCCGIGDSTEVLAWYAPPGSEILGLEYNHDFATRAATRRYCHDSGRATAVAFRAQSVLEEFCGADGVRIPDASVDLVNSSGAVGCHFDPPATTILAREVVRTLRPGGIALIDSGSHGTDARTVVDIFGALGCEHVKESRSCALDRYVQVCLRRPS